jgi:hypothetical protein
MPMVTKNTTEIIIAGSILGVVEAGAAGNAMLEPGTPANLSLPIQSLERSLDIH